MKTEQEIQEASDKDIKIRTKAARKEIAAQVVFQIATKKELAEFEKVVRPAQKRWQEFSTPHRAILNTKILAIRKDQDEAIGELQANWENCPKCETPYGRYDTFCCNDKCKINLLTYSKIKGIVDIKEDNKKISSDNIESSQITNVAGQCPECGSLLTHQEGCYICRACGYTKC